MMSLIGALSLGSQLIVAAADTVPSFNVEPNCRAALEDDPSDMNVRQNVESCVNDERQARDELKSNWSHYSAADKARCVSESTMGGQASYVELQICLQMIQDAKELSQKSAATGSDSKTRSKK